MTVSLTVNRQKRSVEAEGDKPLLWVLREDLGMAGTKFGCGAGLCGACTVLLNGQAVRSCQTPLSEAAGARITTIEGVTSIAAGRKLVDAWVALDVPQCGYCQAGQIMTATALLTSTPKPDAAEVNSAMSGNICRCASYDRIRAAVAMAAGATREGGGA